MGSASRDPATVVRQAVVNTSQKSFPKLPTDKHKIGIDTVTIDAIVKARGALSVRVVDAAALERGEAYDNALDESVLQIFEDWRMHGGWVLVLSIKEYARIGAFASEEYLADSTRSDEGDTHKSCIHLAVRKAFAT